MENHNPQNNNVQIERVKGDIKALEVKVDGHIERQSEDVEDIKNAAQKMAESLERSCDKNSEYFNRLFCIADEHGREIVKLDARIEGQETLGEARDNSLREKIVEIKGAIELAIKNQFDGFKADKKEMSSLYRWAISLFISGAIAAIGWFLAI